MSQFIFGFLLACIVIFTVEHFRKRDDSDSHERSGLKVRTDALTGVQYLETVDGGITPRLNADKSLVVVGTEAAK